MTNSTNRRARTLALLFVSVAALTMGTSLSAQDIAITGGTIYTGTGDRIENGTVLIRNGRITQVGTDVSVPAAARRIDAGGKWVTPGLFAVGTQLGLVEIGAVPDTREDTLAGDRITPAFNVLEGINPASQLIPVARVEGITTALTVPSRGLIRGQGVLIDLWGDDVTAMRVSSPAVMVGAVNESAKFGAGGSRAAVMAEYRRLLNDARELAERREDYRSGRMQPLSAPADDLEALLPVLRGELPLMLIANRTADISNALKLAAEFNIDLILSGAEEGWKMAREIAEAGVFVSVNPLSNRPSYDALSSRLDNAALLSSAGVSLIIETSSSHNAREVKQAAGNAVAYGMSWDAALRALTIEPARAFRVADDYGSLESGKVANVVVWSGDPFELSTAAERVFIRGEEVPPDSRQRELLERYRSLPPSYHRR